jgi:hypothetical protein
MGSPFVGAQNTLAGGVGQSFNELNANAIASIVSACKPVGNSATIQPSIPL